MELTTYQWGQALLATFILGISKAGIKGISVIIVAIMAWVFGSKSSTGVLMPLLNAADLIAVFYYTRHANWKLLWRLLPWMAIGVLFGVYLGKDLPEDIFKQGMAVIILLTVGMMFWWDRNPNRKIPNNIYFAGGMGLAAGFTTMIGNLAGAFSNIFFLAMRLPKNEFIGTAAWLFFIINLFKLPFHIFVWKTVNWQSILVNVRLVPALILGFIVGIFLVKKIKDHTYRYMILVLTAIGAIAIFFR